MSSSALPSSSDDGDARSHAKPNSTPPTKSSAASSDSEPKTPRRSSVMKKSRDGSRPDTRVGPKQSRDRLEAKLPASKKKKNSRKTGVSGNKSQIDIEELLAQTYPKEPSVLGDETHITNGLEMPSEHAKDTAKKWSAEDEISLANAVLASSAGGQVNMTAFYERAKETLQSESHGQIYEKMRRMRSRFWTIESQLRDAKIAEDFFPYRSMHEADLYKVWKQIWGRHERRNEAAQDIEMEQNRELRSRSHARQVHNGDVNEDRHESRTEAAHMNGEPRSHSHAMQRQNGEVTDDPPEEEEEEEEHQQAEEEDNVVETAGKTPSRVACNHDEEFNLIQTEIKALVCKVKNNVQTMLDDTEAKMEGLIDSLFKRAVVAAQVQSLGSEVGIGSCLCSSLSRRMKELECVRSVREFPGLNEAEAKILQQKWRKHQIEELRTFSGRLELLQEECKLCIKDLETANSSHNS